MTRPLTLRMKLDIQEAEIKELQAENRRLSSALALAMDEAFRLGPSPVTVRLEQPWLPSMPIKRRGIRRKRVR